MPAPSSSSDTTQGIGILPFLHALLLLALPFMILSKLAPLTSTLPIAALASVLPVIMLSKLFRPVRYYFRLTTFLLGLASNSVWGVLASIAMSAAGKAGDVNWLVARSFWKSTAPLVGIRFRVEGEEHLTDREGPVVMVGNHQTMLDILCTYSPSRFFASFSN